MNREFSVRRSALWRVLGCLLALFAAACGRGERASATTRDSRERPRIAVVTHGQASDPFWSVVKNGIDQAAKDMGVTVTYQAPQAFDMVAMSRLIDAEVARKPDGLIISMPDPAALARSLQAARDAGIPIITINAGGEEARKMGALLHIGQSEYDAGKAGGERLARAGVRHAICVNHEVGNVSQDERCRGFLDALTKAGGEGRVLSVNAASPTDMQQKILAATRPEVDGVFTLGPAAARAALAALPSANRLGTTKLATFDLSPEILAAVRDGQILFAIDQQQYLQGYLAIVLLTQYAQHGVLPAAEAIPTGPSFVTRENAAAVIDASKKGIR
ncbi:sugar ABC transporter substrate-binding protein [Polyangium mundeleinium]|uniref:Sugar ABC transporter substrate-binding protein n=1 Tax=Polyangium mundeleinium TaxID=2995306 RepID=A0ABT5ET79_9BACT|nr:sugar ABC transporter substrate-binding protein [Polyangium mundeleinium]MDC0745035.1 sugar ABC transporter substrate-binding protein [Polyangium mundeleinium]